MDISAPLLGGRILITGGASGIGSEVARQVGRSGGDVVVLDRNFDGAKAFAASLSQEGFKASAYQADVSNLEELRALADRVRDELGDIDGIVNCAGVDFRERFEDTNFVEKWKTSFSVNVDGTMYTILAFLDHLKRTKGAVVNLASTCAFAAGSCSTAYGPTKAAVKLLTATIARDLAQYGIRVNAIAPGLVATEMTAGMRGDSDVMRVYNYRSKLKRAAEPSEIAQPIVIMLSSVTSYMTAATIAVDGGFTG